MQNSDRHAFVFARDWTHAGVTYARGDTTELPANDVEKAPVRRPSARPKNPTRRRGRKPRRHRCNPTHQPTPKPAQAGFFIGEHPWHFP